MGDFKVRGTAFKTDAQFIVKNYGKKALLKIEERLRKLGYPLKYDIVSNSKWYSLNLRYLSFKVMKDVLKMSLSDFKKMGYEAPKNSLIIKLLLGFLISLRLAFKKSNFVWHKYYSCGDLILKNFDNNKKMLVLELKNFKSTPFFISYLEGFFSRLFNFLKPNIKVNIKSKKEKNCYVFTMRWKDG